MRYITSNAEAFYGVRCLILAATTLICASLLTPANAQMSCTPPPLGLVGWWPGEGNANDIISGNNGTLSNDVTFATGEVGQAFDFTGTNEVVVSNAADLNLDQAFTIKAWVRFDNLNSSHCIVCKGTIGYHQYALLSGDLASSDELELLVESQGNYDGPYSVLTTSQAHLVPDTWYHIVATADGTSKSIYLDGQLLASNPSAAPYTPDSSPVEIGAANLGSVAFFDGLVDEVSIYNRALSQTEIQAIYNAGSAGKCNPGIPEITSISVASSNVLINFLTASNYVYGIQTSTDLVLGSWNTIASNIPSVMGPTNYFDVGGATMTQKFYRLFHY